jgi:hypothetical protein
MELHIIAAWSAFALSIVIPIALGYHLSKKQKRRQQQALLGVVYPNKNKRTK